jgi:hypothetical protein
MTVPACAVGRLRDDGPWVGFAPALDDGYELVVADGHAGTHRAAADADDLLSLAIAYFAEALGEPPEELAATLADIASLVRHLSAVERQPLRRRALDEAVDAVDDGLAADVVVSRLTTCLEGAEEPIARLERRADQLSVSGSG